MNINRTLLFFLFCLDVVITHTDFPDILSPFSFFVAQNRSIDAEKNSEKDVFKTDENEDRQNIELDEDNSDKKILQNDHEEMIYSNKNALSDRSKDSIELDLDNADLSTLVEQVKSIFNVTFVSDDIIDPVAPDTRPIKGNKISFKTHKSLSKEEAWNVFVTLMDLARFSVISLPEPHTYRIISADKAKKNALNTFIGIKSKDLPDTDELIRYVYFIENSNIDTLTPIIDGIRSLQSERVFLKGHKAFVITDKAYNIKMLMKIIDELDSENNPETLLVIKLRYADARQVFDLYQNLLPKDDALRLSVKKQPTALFFPENVRMIPESRTNALILLGARDSIEKIEDFITKHIDIPLEQLYSPFFIYRLKYADAETIAEILNNTTQFGKDNESTRSGGIRGNDRYMKPMIFVAEKQTNSVIIKGSYEDYLVVKDLIDKLDEQQPQISIQFLITSININDQKILGGQIRSRSPGTSALGGSNVAFQTSGLFTNSGGQTGIVTNNTTSLGVDKLLGNLLNLITSNVVPGTTVLALGSDTFGVWGIFEALQSITNAEVVANPFLITTNKTPAVVSIGQERRVITAVVSSATSPVESFGSDKAVLEIKTTPQINSDGKIVLDLNVVLDNFTDPNVTSGTKSLKNANTSIIMSDGEIAAVGGFIQTNVTYTQSKVPILGDIPLVGWMFKNKQKVVTDSHLLILLTVSIVDTNNTAKIDLSTDQRIAQYHGTLDKIQRTASPKDPIHRLFFEQQSASEDIIEDLIFSRKGKSKRKEQRMRKSKRKKVGAVAA